MSRIRFMLFAAAVGFIASIGVLTLYVFGVAGVLNVHEIDLELVLWPSSVFLKAGWHATVYATSFTLFLILLNCMTYSAVAVILHLVLNPFLTLTSRRRLHANQKFGESHDN